MKDSTQKKLGAVLFIILYMLFQSLLQAIIVPTVRAVTEGGGLGMSRSALAVT